MTSSVFTEPSPQYRDASGNVCAGGSLKFFASGTLNAQDVFSDSALATNIGATVPLGSDGRATSGTSTITVYLDDSLQYRAQLFDANGAKQWDVDPINPQAAVGNTIPALVNGYFLSNDGSQLLWDLIRQLPDPTGQSGKVLTTDGAGFSWIAKPADGTPGAAGTNAAVTVTPTSVKWSNGTGDKFYIQTGSSTAPASGIPSTSTSVTFPVAFKATPVMVKVSVTSNAFANEGKLAVDAITTKSATGFTVGFDTNTSTDNIFAAVPFDWVAFGTIAS